MLWQEMKYPLWDLTFLKWEPTFGVKPQRLTQACDMCYKVDWSGALGVILIIILSYVREMQTCVCFLVLIQTNYPPV